MSTVSYDLCNLIASVECARPRSYSGRGMYGDYCVGVTVDYPDSFLLALAEAVEAQWLEPEEEKALRAVLRGVSRDSMGFSTILYWRGAEWTEACEKRWGVDEYA